MVKIYQGWGHISTARRFGWLFKITTEVKQLLEKAIQDTLYACLNEIKKSIEGLKITCTTVNKVSKQLGIRLLILRKKSFLVPFAKIHCKY